MPGNQPEMRFWSPLEQLDGLIHLSRESKLESKLDEKKLKSNDTNLRIKDNNKNNKGDCVTLVRGDRSGIHKYIHAMSCWKITASLTKMNQVHPSQSADDVLS